MDSSAGLSLDRATNRVDMLAALRVLAWFSVFGTHVIVVSPPGVLHSLHLLGHDVSWLLLTPAWGGVWIFFVLSGYVIGRAFLSGRYGLTRGELGRFWLRRCLRIVPLYYLVYLVVLLFAFPGMLHLRNWPYLLRMFTFTYYGQLSKDPLSATWFLSALMQFYLLAPLLFVCLRPLLRRRGDAALGVAVALLIGAQLRYVPLLIFHAQANPLTVWNGWIYTPIWTNLDLVAVGMLANAFIAGADGRASGTARRLKIAALLAMLLGWFATSYIANAGLNEGHLLLQRVFTLGCPALFALLALLWITAFVDQKKRVPLSWAALQENPRRLLEALAALTYGVFLWHSPILIRIGDALSWGGPLRTYALRFGLGLALSLLLAGLTYFMVERPSQRLANRLTLRRASARTTQLTALTTMTSEERLAGLEDMRP